MSPPVSTPLGLLCKRWSSGFTYNPTALYALKHQSNDSQGSWSSISQASCSSVCLLDILLGVQFCFIEFYWVSCCWGVISLMREVIWSSYLPSLRVHVVRLHSDPSGPSPEFSASSPSLTHDPLPSRAHTRSGDAALGIWSPLWAARLLSSVVQRAGCGRSQPGFKSLPPCDLGRGETSSASHVLISAPRSLSPQSSL